MQISDIQAFAHRIMENISRVIVGNEAGIELLLAAVIARGHVLFEDVPGTGKTLLARSLAKSVDCKFTRIQFTPDLLPSDITGMRIYQPKTGEFSFLPGPVFTNILLADEINRATPRTQSALLECMEERQVTEGGVTRKLEPPFIVIATQNPVEIQGTFPLPEAQLDRFLMRIKLGYPKTGNASAILSRFLRDDPIQGLAPVAAGKDVQEAQSVFSQAEVSPAVQEYIVALCEKTRSFENVQLGVSPRGMLALMRASQALCLIRGRSFVTPDDVKAAAIPVLAHRIITRGQYGRQGISDAVVHDALDSTPVPTESR